MTRKSGRTTPRLASPMQRFLARMVAMVVRIIGGTQRMVVLDPHAARAVVDSAPVVFAVWHNRLALSPFVYRELVSRNEGRRLAALVSASRDGAFLSEILAEFGVASVRGSSSRRGAQALLELTTLAEQGFDLAITPDGPRGPRYRVQAGAVSIARLTGMPVVPIAVNCPWKIRLRSWDQFQIPLPFGRAEIVLGPVLRIDPQEASLDAAMDELGRRLMQMTSD